MFNKVPVALRYINPPKGLRVLYQLITYENIRCEGRCRCRCWMGSRAPNYLDMMGTAIGTITLGCN